MFPIPKVPQRQTPDNRTIGPPNEKNLRIAASHTRGTSPCQRNNVLPWTEFAKRACCSESHHSPYAVLAYILLQHLLKRNFSGLLNNNRKIVY